MSLNASAFSSKKPDWETPDNLFNLLNKEFGFTLDAAATKDNAKVDLFLTPAQDALSVAWTGKVWLNPPYGRGIASWIKKAALEANNAEVVVALVPCRTDTRWWHDWVMPYASEIRFLTRRLTFKGAGNKAPMPCAIVVFDLSAVGLVCGAQEAPLK